MQPGSCHNSPEYVPLSGAPQTTGAHNNLERVLKVGENYRYFSKHTRTSVPAAGRSATAGWWMKLGDDP